MAKQSPKDPKFRCNICKEYYYAPEHMVHYQCPKHGYLCQKHIGIKCLIYGHNEIDNPNQIEKDNTEPQNDPYWDKIIDFPTEFIGKCLCHEENNYMEGFNYLEYDNTDPFYSLEYKLESRLKRGQRCRRIPAKFLWNENLKRWLEEGTEKEEEFLKLEKIKKISKSNNSEIKLLLDLFEKNILTKDQFIEQLKGKL